jgi:hypothetical protein
VASLLYGTLATFGRDTFRLLTWTSRVETLQKELKNVILSQCAHRSDQSRSGQDFWRLRGREEWCFRAFIYLGYIFYAFFEDWKYCGKICLSRHSLTSKVLFKWNKYKFGNLRNCIYYKSGKLILDLEIGKFFSLWS